MEPILKSSLTYRNTLKVTELLRRSLYTILKRIFQVNSFFSFHISNILFKIVVNDLLNNLSMMVGPSLRLLEPCKKEIIDHDLEENV